MHSLVEHFPFIIGTFGLSAAAWAGIGAVGGIGASLYGANKSAQAQQAAIDANARAQEESNRLNYQRWLESQGVGQDGQPINTWLPRYAMATRPTALPPGFGVFGSGSKVPTMTVANVGTNGVPSRMNAPTLGSMGRGAGSGSPSYADLLGSLDNRTKIPNENAP